MRSRSTTAMLLAIVLSVLTLHPEAKAQTAEQFLADKVWANMGFCLIPNRGVLFCETYVGEKGIYVVIYDENAEPFAINQLFPDGGQVTVWTEGEPV